jgi:hypothetical protein
VIEGMQLRRGFRRSRAGLFYRAMDGPGAEVGRGRRRERYMVWRRDEISTWNCD